MEYAVFGGYMFIAAALAVFVLGFIAFRNEVVEKLNDIDADNQKIIHLLEIREKPDVRKDEDELETFMKDFKRFDEEMNKWGRERK